MAKKVKETKSQRQQKNKGPNFREAAQGAALASGVEDQPVHVEEPTNDAMLRNPAFDDQPKEHFDAVLEHQDPQMSEKAQEVLDSIEDPTANEDSADPVQDAASTESAGEGSEPTDTEGEEPKERNSVVKDKFKTKYIENARALGVGGKAAKRSTWDWLAQRLAGFCLDDKGKIDIHAFMKILDANGVDHSKWTNRNRGWEGRLRMTGRVALQKVVANSGVLKLPAIGEGEAHTPEQEVAAPADWIERFKTKA